MGHIYLSHSHHIAIYAGPIPWDVSHRIPIGMTFPWTSLVFQFFAPEVKHFYEKNTWKDSQIIFIQWKWLKTLNDFGKEFASEGVEAAYIARTVFSCIAIAYLKSCVWLLLVAVTLPTSNASCERNFSKMKWWKQFPEIPWPVKDWATLIDPLSVERYELKNRFRWFRWWIWQSTWQSKD